MISEESLTTIQVSIPSRGSGKGDTRDTNPDGSITFQSPLGEVVKETKASRGDNFAWHSVSIPSRGSGKGDSRK